ncbi:MAG TPA: glutamate--tRNA ligase [Gemmatimonadaceae bacterium]|nr:glutamate--tRNA ligase [Gemmatimonadaceae bacterium]
MTFPAVRVRFAPSPTGYLHVGGARTALFNWLYARKHGGQFLLRIEDTDKARSTDESTRAIFDGLTWLGLGWDEDVVHQGANLERHGHDAQHLLDGGHAYRCFCTADELEQRRKHAAASKDAFKYDRRCDRLDPTEVARRVAAGAPFVIRFRVPEGITSWDDMVHESISFPNKDVEDFVILRSDGTPIYNMAVTSDDVAMRISHVMRGDDHISNTPKQILLYRALGAELPRFAHFPMIHGLDGKKLSKRHGATAVADYQHMGILPQAMNNFLALLGWSPGSDREVMTMEEMVWLFSQDGLLRKASVFDPKKLEWMNGQHISRLSGAELAPLAAATFVRFGLLAPDDPALPEPWFHRVLDFVKERCRTLDDLARLARPFLPHVKLEIDPALVESHLRKDPVLTRQLLLESADMLGGLDGWKPVVMEGALRALAERRGVAAGKVFQPMRVALTGSTVSPGIFDVLSQLGRDVSVTRLRDAAALLA